MPERVWESASSQPSCGLSVMENKLIKIGGIVGLLIISFSIFYYFIIYLPKQRQTDREIKTVQELYDRKLNCAEAGSKYSKELETELQAIIKAYLYNEVLGRCIIRYSFYLSGTNGKFIYNHSIQDIYTKENIYGYSGNEKSAYDTKQQELFFQKEKELFGVNYH